VLEECDVFNSTSLNGTYRSTRYVETHFHVLFLLSTGKGETFV